MNILRIRHRMSNRVVAEGPLGYSCLCLGKNYYIRTKYLEGKPRGHFSWGLSWVGILSLCDLVLPGRQLIRNLFRRVIFPNPFFPFLWGRAQFPLENAGRSSPYIVEVFSSDDSIKLPLHPEETEVREERRIHYLIQNALTLIEHREESFSTLYKDPLDGRLWQFYPGQSGQKLIQVTPSQWSYQYLEQKESTSGFFDSDKEYYEALEPDPGSGPCAIPGCEAFRVRFSELCRDHHFEMVRGKTYRNL